MAVGSRNQRIDIIRGVSIVLVLLNHFNIAYRLDDTILARAIGWDAVRAVVRNGNYGVTMFFVVSGYLITSNADRRWGGLAHVRSWTFYGLRAARIVPCLLLLLATVNAVALSGVPIFQNHVPHGAPPSLWLVDLAALTFWMNVLIDRYGWANYPLGVLWSLSVEEVFYLSFPILCHVLRREARLAAFWAVMVVAGPLYRFTHQGDEAGYLYAYVASFDGIAIGCCTALLARRVELRGPISKTTTVLAVIGMASLYLWRSIEQTNVLGVTAMAFGTALLLLCADRRPTSPITNRSYLPRGLAHVGRLSYEIYLFHVIVLGAIRTVLPPRRVMGDVKLLLLAAFVIVTVLLGALIARRFAEPLNRLTRRLMSRRVVEAA